MLVPANRRNYEPGNNQGKAYVVREITREVVIAKETIRTIELIDGSFIVEIEEEKEVLQNG